MRIAHCCCAIVLGKAGLRSVLLPLLFLMAGCKEEVLHGLDELKGNQALVVLANAGVKAEKVRSGTKWDIRVDSSQLTTALHALDESRILKKLVSTETKRSEPLIPSREERAHELERKTALALEDTLTRVPGVLEARVHLFLGNQGELTLTPRREFLSASVLIIGGSGGAEEQEVTAQRVKQLVAGASGLKIEQVTVLILPSTTPLKSDLSGGPTNHTLEVSPELSNEVAGVTQGVTGTVTQTGRPVQPIVSIANQWLQGNYPRLTAIVAVCCATLWISLVLRDRGATPQLSSSSSSFQPKKESRWRKKPKLKPGDSSMTSLSGTSLNS